MIFIHTLFSDNNLSVLSFLESLEVFIKTSHSYA
uniref:Uncharacterized protein n=1 Tax=Anguilla anguilla TaxID=7936 RepID=A0A0E9SRT4_ANGAN